MHTTPQPGSRGAPPPGAADHRAGKYLTFRLGAEEFGIRVDNVREIMSVPEITAVPQMPAYVKGVINLRGKAIPVVDLRVRFGLDEIGYTQRTCIIVVQAPAGSGSGQAGLVVDAVSEVLKLAGAEIANTPALEGRPGSHFIFGTARRMSKLRFLLHLDRIVPGDAR